MVFFWIALAIVFLIIEGVTFNLVTIWFAAGSFLAAFLAIMGVSSLIQVLTFIITSSIMLYFLIPYILRKNKKIEKTNFDRIIGRKALVTETIDNLKGIGTVNVDGQIWSAASKDSEVIEKDEEIIVLEIKGVKVIVERMM